MNANSISNSTAIFYLRFEKKTKQNECTLEANDRRSVGGRCTLHGWFSIDK